MATGRLPDPNTAPVTAKGDLYTYSTVPAKLAVGSNGETLVADSSTSTGLRYQGSTAAGRNVFINGGMDIWQRGTSFTASGVYAADRFIVGRAGGAVGATYTRQVTGDTTNLPSIQYCLRLQRDSGNTSTANIGAGTVVETANAIPYAGKTVTMSFYARVGANFSATSSTINAYLVTGTGTDQNGILGAWTGAVTAFSQNFTATTTWQRFSVSGTLASNATEFYNYINFTPTGTAGAADYLEVTGIQLEIGSVATPFSRAGGTIAGELAACQRYFWTSDMSNAQIGTAYSATAAMFSISLPVSMRIAPTATYPTTLTGIINDLVNAQNRTPGALGTYVNRVDKVSFTATGLPAASLAAGYPVMINQSGFTWSAEL